MKEKVSDLKFTGFICFAIGAVLIYNTWNRSGTLPADFLLGALAAWGIACGMHKFENSDKMDDE